MKTKVDNKGKHTGHHFKDILALISTSPFNICPKTCLLFLLRSTLYFNFFQGANAHPAISDENRLFVLMVKIKIIYSMHG